MIYIFKDKPIQVQWEIFKAQSRVHEDFIRAKVWMFLVGDSGRYVLDAHAENGVITTDINASFLPEGTYSVEAMWVKNWERDLNACHHHHGIEHHHHHHHHHPINSLLPHQHQFARQPHMMPNDELGNFTNISRVRRDWVFAITEYIEEDNTGTTDVATLKMNDNVASYGYDGLDSYQLAIVEGRFNGSEGEWFEAMQGQDGQDGIDGKDGSQAIYYTKATWAEAKEQGKLNAKDIYVIQDAAGAIVAFANDEKINDIPYAASGIVEVCTAQRYEDYVNAGVINPTTMYVIVEEGASVVSAMYLGYISIPFGGGSDIDEDAVRAIVKAMYDQAFEFDEETNVLSKTNWEALKVDADEFWATDGYGTYITNILTDYLKAADFEGKFNELVESKGIAKKNDIAVEVQKELQNATISTQNVVVDANNRLSKVVGVEGGKIVLTTDKLVMNGYELYSNV